MSDESDSSGGARPGGDEPSDASKPGGGGQRRRRRRGRRGAARKRRPGGASNAINGEASALSAPGAANGDAPVSPAAGAPKSDTAVPGTPALRNSRRKSRRSRKRRGAAKARSADSAAQAGKQSPPVDAPHAEQATPQAGATVEAQPDAAVHAAPALHSGSPRRRSTDAIAASSEAGEGTAASEEAKRQALAARRARAERETSAGGIVYRVQDGEALFLLIRDSYRNWGFPKGHLEAGELPDAAALREVTEETGLAELHLDGAIETIDWFFRFRGRLVHKVCHFYLMRTEHSRTVPQREEGITACRWARYEEATRLISYANARAVLMRANDMVNLAASDDAEGDRP